MESASTAVKKPVNVSISSDVLREARELKINVSQVLETALRQQVKRLREAQWLAENQESIASYNAWVEKDGLWSDAWRDRLWSGEDAA